MGNPLQHAESSVRKFGGSIKDYIKIHQIMDMSKRYIADWRHRTLFHNTFGIHMMEEYIIGPTFTRTDGEVMDTRTVVSEHIKEDMAGVIPTPADFLREMPIAHWMSGVSRTKRKRMQSLSMEGSAEPPVIKETIVWFNAEYAQPENAGTYLCKVQGVNHIIRMIYEGGDFVSPEGRKILYWAEFPIGP
jgi:hypothetical protein